jgi:hypothetical protein
MLMHNITYGSTDVVRLPLDWEAESIRRSHVTPEQCNGCLNLQSPSGRVRISPVYEPSGIEGLAMVYGTERRVEIMDQRI